jgi:hypothetical protein
MSIDARRLEAYYDESVPPSLLPYATGATAGIPGAFTPVGSIVPVDPASLAQASPLAVIANPVTPWTVGQYVQTGTSGAAGRASWSGTAWVSGAAPAAEEVVVDHAPTTASTKAEIIDWLVAHDDTLDVDTLGAFTKTELLDMVAEVK